ncbi:MAG: glycosyltransferase family 9 protein [Candidatus Omnitrophica bacterium]|nr:glycosyltransferase family 9 protein [Candidatus Omnitrophota bacterium]
MMKNILAIRNDRFGEFLLNIPAFRALKESFPGSLLTLAVSPAVKELAECVEYADQVVIWDDDFEKNLRKQKFDTCVVLNPTKEAHWISFWAGIPKRVGYNRKWGILLTHKIQDNKNLGLKHEVEYNLDLVGLIGAKTSDKIVRLGKLPQYNKPEYVGAIAVHPFTSDTLKQWPIDKFRQLIKRLSEEAGVKVLVVGRDEVIGREYFDNLGSSIINLVNRTSLVELAQILKQCKLLVTCDSGPMHLAAAVGIPVVALFRNDLAGKTPKRWGPWGKRHVVIEKGQLTDISVEEVLDKAKYIRYS